MTPRRSAATAPAGIWLNDGRVRVQGGRAAAWIAQIVHELHDGGIAWHGTSAALIAATECRRVAAAHEAGHAVAHALTGWRVRRVRVWEHKPGRWAGEVQGGQAFVVTPDTPADDLIAHAFRMMAGWIGEALVIGGGAIGSSVDEVALGLVFLAQAGQVMGVPDQHRWIAHAEAGFAASIRRHRKSFNRIRHRLERRRSLEGRELARLLPRPEPHLLPSTGRIAP